MSAFRLTWAARNDLKQIAIYTEQRWGRRQRNVYLRRIDALFHRLAEHPGLGAACDDIRPGYRKMPFLSHILFYRVGADGVVEIVRILHQRMDIQRIISE